MNERKNNASPISNFPDARSLAPRVVFFDLDGTLLPMDLDEFMDKYYKRIARYVSLHQLDVVGFKRGFEKAVYAMMHHDARQTNEDAFWEKFMSEAGGTREAWESEFMKFYRGDFNLIARDFDPNPRASEVVDVLAGKGYPLVLATTPLFPRVAVEQRLAWAGLSPQAFVRITTYENSCSLKPASRYFAENLAALNVSGADVLMVGNNTVEDYAAAKLGCQVVLCTDFLLNPAHVNMFTIPHGTFDQFADWAQKLPACNNPAVCAQTGVVDAFQRESALSANMRMA